MSGARSRVLYAVLAAMVFSATNLVWAGQMDLATFGLLRRGMPESELLFRAGPPDLDTSVGVTERGFRAGSLDASGDKSVDFGEVQRRTVTFQKEWHYIPGPGDHDPYLTVITLSGGRIIDLRRVKMFSRSKFFSPPQPTREPAPSQSTVQIQRADSTLRAAEEYASTRARLKERAELEAETQTTPPGDATVYQGIADDGSVYFGDQPMVEPQ